MEDSLEPQVQGARLLRYNLGEVLRHRVLTTKAKELEKTTDKTVASLRIVALREPSSDRARSRIVLETRAQPPS